MNVLHQNSIHIPDITKLWIAYSLHTTIKLKDGWIPKHRKENGNSCYAKTEYIWTQYTADKTSTNVLKGILKLYNKNVKGNKYLTFNDLFCK